MLLTLYRLLEVGRNVNKAETEAIRQCAYYFQQLDQVNLRLRNLQNNGEWVVALNPIQYTYIQFYIAASKHMEFEQFTFAAGVCLMDMLE